MEISTVQAFLKSPFVIAADQALQKGGIPFSFAAVLQVVAMVADGSLSSDEIAQLMMNSEVQKLIGWLQQWGNAAPLNGFEDLIKCPECGTVFMRQAGDLALLAKKHEQAKSA
jgi:hypothetical protein